MKELKKNMAGLLVLILGIALVVLGVFRTEQETVLTKAINICLECIGIG